MDHHDASPDDLELALRVSPPMVTAVRSFVQAIVERLGADPELSGRVSLTVHELVENVAKYGTSNRAVLHMRLSPNDAHGPRLTLTVTNTASESQIARLQQVFQDMEAGGDPFAHYFMLMQREVAKGESGLGLARIRAEAEMPLCLTVDRNVVSISATCTPFSAANVMAVRS